MYSDSSQMICERIRSSPPSSFNGENRCLRRRANLASRSAQLRAPGTASPAAWTVLRHCRAHDPIRSRTNFTEAHTARETSLSHTRPVLSHRDDQRFYFRPHLLSARVACHWTPASVKRPPQNNNSTRSIPRYRSRLDCTAYVLSLPVSLALS